MSMTLTPAVYVCVVSNYNLPDLEACLARHPSDIVLVVSDPEAFEQAAERLEQQLDSRRRRENFRLRCQASQVALCDSRAALLDFAGLVKSP